MSPSWNDRLLVAFRPDGVRVLRIARGWRPKLKVKTYVPCLQDSQSPKWGAALQVLADILRQKEWQHASVAVVLSQHFVRSAVIPPDIALKNQEEEDAFARCRLSEATGELNGDWQLRFADARPGMPRLTCAIDSTLFDSLVHAVTAAGNKLTSVRPYFVAAHDSRRRHFSKQDAWFVATEPDRCTLLQLRKGSVWNISSRRIFAAAETELPAFLEQERLLAHSDTFPEKVFLAAAEPHRIAFPQDSAWNVLPLPASFCAGLSPHTDAAYGMALEAGA